MAIYLLNHANTLHIEENFILTPIFLLASLFHLNFNVLCLVVLAIVIIIIFLKILLNLFSICPTPVSIGGLAVFQVLLLQLFLFGAKLHLLNWS